MREEVAKRKQDEIDFENKFGRTLVREETLQGRTYKPYSLAANENMFDDIIARENATLKTDFEAIQYRRYKIYICTKMILRQVRSKYEIRINQI